MAAGIEKSERVADALDCVDDFAADAVTALSNSLGRLFRLYLSLVRLRPSDAATGPEDAREEPRGFGSEDEAEPDRVELNLDASSEERSWMRCCNRGDREGLYLKPRVASETSARTAESPRGDVRTVDMVLVVEATLVLLSASFCSLTRTNWEEASDIVLRSSQAG